MSDFPLPSLSLISNRPATTSLAIAEHFEKQHKDVLESIRKLIADCPEDFNGRNFSPVEYEDAKGEKRPMFHVFFDGFMLLVMGYTGPKALKMKLAYIAAFNAMREKLEAARNASLPATPASQLPPAHLATLHAIVDGLVRKSGQTDGKAIRVTRLRIWNSFRTHFGVAKYADLPADKMEEASAFLMRQELPEAEMPVPSGLMAKCPFTPAEKASARKELESLTRQLAKIFHALKDGMRPGPADMEVYSASRKFFDMRMYLARMASRNVYAARQALEMALNMLEE